MAELFQIIYPFLEFHPGQPGEDPLHREGEEVSRVGVRSSHTSQTRWRQLFLLVSVEEVNSRVHYCTG